MNVLEKILKEISEVEKEYVTGHKVLYALGATSMATEISSIIRSHMDDVPDNDSGWIPVEERVPEDLAPAVLTYMLATELKRFHGTVTSQEIGLPVSSNGLVLPCGASGRWEAK